MHRFRENGSSGIQNSFVINLFFIIILSQNLDDGMTYNNDCELYPFSQHTKLSQSLSSYFKHWLRSQLVVKVTSYHMAGYV